MLTPKFNTKNVTHFSVTLMNAIAPAHKEQGQKILHSNWQIGVGELSPRVCEDLLSDPKIQHKKCDKF